MFIAVRGIVVATIFIALWFWVAVSVRRVDPTFGFTLPAWLIWGGWLLTVAGGLLTFSCVALFATRGRGTPAPFDAPRIFVASGPYQYVRNPMYIGAFSVLVGSGFIVQSISILLLSVAFLLLAHFFVVLYEEPALESRFGESYANYRRQVRRWLPRTSLQQ